MDGPSEVANLYNPLKYFIPYLMEQYVFRFDVPVDDIAIVHEFYGVADLPRDAPDPLLSEAALLLEAVVDIPAAAEFQHQVEVVLICEEGVQLHDIRMVQVTLDLYLSYQLADELHLSLEDVLRDLLDRADEVSRLMTVLRSPYRLR